MQRGLYSMGASTPFCSFIKVTPYQHVQRIVNDLLDGSTHVQIIGQPQQRFEIDCFLDETGKSILESLNGSGGLMTVVDVAGTYSGRIVSMDIPTREVVSGSVAWYRIRFVLAEGVVDE